jgi:Tfp pilus assembly protein PilE
MSGKRKSRGFTVLEMAIVILVGGTLVAGIAEMYRVYLNEQRVRTTYSRMTDIEQALIFFVAHQGRYPCPADPSLPQNDPNEGLENCAAATALTAAGQCTGGGNNGICRVNGRVAPVTDPVTGNTVNETLQVLNGAVPYRTLLLGLTVEVDSPAPQTKLATTNFALSDTLSASNSMDAWGNRYMYSVPVRLSAAVQAGDLLDESAYSAISVQTEDGTDLTQPAGTAQYVVYAAGENKVGAYGSGGQRAIACAGSAAEIQNCDSNVNATFVQGLQSNTYDDFLVYGALRDFNLWEPNDRSDLSKGIHNINPGNVGIGTTTPKEKLHIVATEGANGSLSTSNKLATPRVCDLSTSDTRNGAHTTDDIRNDLLTGDPSCFRPYLFGEYSLDGQCPHTSTTTFGVMTKVAKGKIVCEQITRPHITMPAMCGLDGLGKQMYLRGFRSTGEPICESPP